jgi:hypothetical protein
VKFHYDHKAGQTAVLLFLHTSTSLFQKYAAAKMPLH